MTVTLITGANKGLGYETARQLLERGHNVYLGARNADRGEAAASAVGGHFVPLDVTDDSSVEEALGIVAKNGILLLDADQRFRAEGASAREAMIEAGERRLRPILMTALATIAGMIPLSLKIGVGSEMLRPLAIAVIGGLAASMVLSLIVTPAVHYYLSGREEA